VCTGNQLTQDFKSFLRQPAYGAKVSFCRELSEPHPIPKPR
jgi:hypothetical protein